MRRSLKLRGTLLTAGGGVGILFGLLMMWSTAQDDNSRSWFGPLIVVDGIVLLVASVVAVIAGFGFLQDAAIRTTVIASLAGGTFCTNCDSPISDPRARFCVICGVPRPA